MFNNEQNNEIMKQLDIAKINPFRVFCTGSGQSLINNSLYMMPFYHVHHVLYHILSKKYF